METNEARMQWEKAAPGWAKWEEVVTRSTMPATEAMLDQAGVVEGKQVLDLASGAGAQTLAAAQRVGPTGQVVANDISPTMLEHVSKNASAAGLSNVSTLLGPVQELEVADNNFDSVISRFALMLIPQPGQVLSSVIKTLKPGGRMAVVVFSVPQANELFVKSMQILLKHAGKTPPPPGSPGIFALGAPGVLEDLYAGAGFTNVGSQLMDLSLGLPSPDQMLEMMKEAFGVYRAVVSDCSEAVQQAAWAEVLDYLKTIGSDEGFSAPIQVIVGWAQKPE